jgi:hypothetical protein
MECLVVWLSRLVAQGWFLAERREGFVVLELDATHATRLRIYYTPATPEVRGSELTVRLSFGEAAVPEPGVHELGVVGVEEQREVRYARWCATLAETLTLATC